MSSKEGLVDIDVSDPATVDAQLIEARKNNVAKSRMILLEGVHNHIVSSIHGKETLDAMWKSLTDMY